MIQEITSKWYCNGRENCTTWNLNLFLLTVIWGDGVWCRRSSERELLCRIYSWWPVLKTLHCTWWVFRPAQYQTAQQYYGMRIVFVKCLLTKIELARAIGFGGWIRWSWPQNWVLGLSILLPQNKFYENLADIRYDLNCVYCLMLVSH